MIIRRLIFNFKMKKTLKQCLDDGAILYPMKSHPWSADKSIHWQIHINLGEWYSSPAFSNLYDSYEECQTAIDHLLSFQEQK